MIHSLSPCGSRLNEAIEGGWILAGDRAHRIYEGVADLIVWVCPTGSVPTIHSFGALEVEAREP